MTQDQKTTLIGIVEAVAMGIFTYLMTGGDPTTPGFWFGMLVAINQALKGYYTNKADRTNS